MINVAIVGTSRIVEEHIKSCRKLGLNIVGVYSLNPRKNNTYKFGKKFKLNIFYNFKNFLSYAKNKNSSFILAPRIVDNDYVLKECIKFGKKIFIEKPVFTNYKKFEKFQKYNSRIFVGFNRIYYNNVNILKKKIQNRKNEILVVCPEKNKYGIISNSCHIISILFYIYGKLDIVYKRKSKKQIYCILKSKINFITIIFNFKSKDLFKIENFSRKEKIIMSPIENMKIYDSLSIKKYKNNNIYTLNKKLEINEFNYTNIKPGLLKQMQTFKMFIQNKKKVVNNLSFASEVVKICNQIIS